MLTIHVKNSTYNAKNSTLTKQNMPVAMKMQCVCVCVCVCVLFCLCACVCLCVCSGGWLLLCQPTNQTGSKQAANRQPTGSQGNSSAVLDLLFLQTGSQGNSSAVLDLLFLHFVRLVRSHKSHSVTISHNRGTEMSQQRCFLGARGASLVQLMNATWTWCAKTVRRFSQGCGSVGELS